MGNDDHRSTYLNLQEEYWNVIRCRSELLDTVAVCTRRWVQNRDNLICGLGNISVNPREDKNERSNSLERGNAYLAEPSIILSPCPSCGRKFSHEASMRHFPICARIKEKAVAKGANERTRLNKVTKQTTMKSEEDKHSSSSSACTVTLVPCSMCGKSFNSEDIGRHVKVCDGKLALNLARENLDTRERDLVSKSHRSMIPRLTPRSSKEERRASSVACPVCTRKFSPKYASRHIPLCSKNKKAEEAQKAKIEGKRSTPPSRRNDKIHSKVSEGDSRVDNRLNRRLNSSTNVNAFGKDQSSAGNSHGKHCSMLEFKKGEEHYQNGSSPNQEESSVCCNCGQNIPKKMVKDHTAVCAKLKAAEIALKSKHSCCSKMSTRKNAIHDATSRRDSLLTVYSSESLIDDPVGLKQRSEGEFSAPAELSFTGKFCPFCGTQLQRESSQTHVELCKRLGKLEDMILMKRDGGGSIPNDRGEQTGIKLSRHGEQQLSPLAVLPCPCCKTMLDVSRI